MQTPEFEILLNPLADRGADYGPAEQAVLNAAEYRRAYSTISAWPGYKATPLVALTGLAKSIGVAGVYYKDESSRFGLGSFKALGGAYAVARLLQRKLAAGLGREPAVAELLQRKYAAEAGAITVCCATDGNHGRSVAWGASLFGCRCVIFIHATVSEARRRAIERYGARVIRTAGNYDDSVHEAQETAAAQGWYVVSDTSYAGYLDVPKDVMQGYTVMAAEALDQLAGNAPLSHVFLQTGVGGMAAAVAAVYWQRYGDQRPHIILADPALSACWLESIRAGRPTAVGGELDTIMAGLACGEVSLLAWQILQTAADAVMSVEDAAAAEAMRLLARGDYGGPALVAGESAVAGLAALLAASANPDARARLGLDADSRVLLFGTEGDTDAEIYRRIVGCDAAEVRARAAVGAA